MEILLSIIPFTFITIINCAFCSLFKKSFGKCLPFSLMLPVFLLFFSQIAFNTFRFGYIFLIILFIISIYIIIKNFDKREYFLSNGFYYFCISYLVFLIINFGRHFFWDDELSHWGKMVKEMIRLDKFYYVNESTLRSHKDYPPFISLFEMFWCNFSLGFSESNCTLGLHVFEFNILFSPILDEIKLEKKNKILNIIFLCIISIGLIVYLDSDNVFNTIYTDIIISTEFAYAIYLIYSNEIENAFGNLCYCFINIAMIMTKQVGIAFVLLSLLFYFINNYKKKSNKVIICGFLFSVIFSVATYLCWNALIKPYDIVKQFDLNKLSVEGFKEIFAGKTYQLDTIKMYVNRLFKYPIYSFPVPMTFVSSFFAEILLLLLKKYSKHFENNNVFGYEFTCLCGTLGYSLLMLILYAFCFPKKEALILISYNRYMSSMIIALLLGILVIFAIDYKKQFNINKVILTSLIVLTIFDYNRILNVSPQLILGNRFSKYNNIANYLNEKVEPNSKVFIVYDQSDIDNYPAFVSYYCDEIYLNRINMDLNSQEYLEEHDYNEIITELKQYDYIYIVETSEIFNNNFCNLNNSKHFENDSLYKIDSKTEKINVYKVG